MPLKDDLLQIHQLRKRPAQQVKRGLAGFIRDVRAAGCIGVTQRGKVDLVFMDVEVYRKLAATIIGTSEPDQPSAGETRTEFDK